MHHLLITGGCGFIGSNFVRLALQQLPACRLVNLDKLTYAGNPRNLADVENDPRYRFVKGDICDSELLPDGQGRRSLIRFVKDCAGHDRRHAIDASKISKELGWEPSLTFEQGFDQTIDWYLAHRDWVEEITSGTYRNYYQQQYGGR